MAGKVEWNIFATSWLTGFANFSYQKIGQTFTGYLSEAGPFQIQRGVRGEWDTGLGGEGSVYYVDGATYPL